MLTSTTDLAIKKHGGFFAFNNAQFKEQASKGVEYKHLCGGLIVPKNNIDDLMSDINKGVEDSIKWDKENNTVKEIVWRELINHEAQYSGLESVRIALSGYEIEDRILDKIYREYIEYCVDNGLI